ncbi:MAG: hypothetical protein ACXWMK_06280, partial [Syntrophales bacterium]
RQDPLLLLEQEVEDTEEPSRVLRWAAGHSANWAILEDNIEATKAPGLAQVGLLADHLVEASGAHQAGLLAHLLWADEVLLADFMAVVVSLEAPMVVAALGALTEEALEEVTGKLKE